MDKKKKITIISIVCAILLVVITLSAVLPIYAFPPTVKLDYGYLHIVSSKPSTNGGRITRTLNPTYSQTEEVKVYRNHTYSPPLISRSEYTFKGWYKDSAFTIPWISCDKVKSNITLYAKWEANK